MLPKHRLDDKPFSQAVADFHDGRGTPRASLERCTGRTLPQVRWAAS